MNKAQRLFWRRGDYGQLARGETVESLVSLAIEKILSGERRWDVEKYPDLEEFLRSVIDSLINHLAMSRENRLLEKLPDNPYQLEAILRKAARATTNRDPGNPETALLEEERIRREREIMERITALLKDDPDLAKICDCIRNGINKPQAIADKTGLPVEVVYQLGRKLRRRLEGLGAEIKASSKAGQ
jgi:hypothetical protein